MGDDQSKPADEQPAEAQSADEQDETHRRFREALERKKQAEHASNERARADDKGVGPSQAKVKRQFRRKSG
ncbi:MAG: hypothetical protein GEV10_10275 [Streptosporangiales bacterium]|nr:hypothetical protein [Streptosporangiales bacterium]